MWIFLEIFPRRTGDRDDAPLMAELDDVPDWGARSRAFPLGPRMAIEVVVTDYLLVSDGDEAVAFRLLVDSAGAESRAFSASASEIRRSALATVFMGQNADVRARSAPARDARISAFRSGWVAQLGEADGALATACA